MSELVKIIMDKADSVNTTKGPVHFLAGQAPEVEPWIAASLVGRGYAHYPTLDEQEEEAQLTPLPDNPEKETVANLRKLAMERGVEEYHLMRKADLIAALYPPKVEGVAPAPQRFDKIDLVPPGTVLNEPNQEID
jgi:hypothetical protein